MNLNRFSIINDCLLLIAYLLLPIPYCPYKTHEPLKTRP